jgi:hypothetical protein
MTDREKLIALLVEAESLCAAIDCYDGAVCEYAGEIDGCAAFRADHLLANGVVVREKGEWLVDGRTGMSFCSVCQVDAVEADTDFCPNCGADMRKGGERWLTAKSVSIPTAHTLGSKGDL